MNDLDLPGGQAPRRYASGLTAGELDRTRRELAASLAGIAAQLAVLDDADLTGVGKSSAGVLGVRSAVLADSLAGHLVQEIRFRGSRGGPPTPLADQVCRLDGGT